MIEQTGKPITFAAFFVNKNTRYGLTGAAPTVTVRRGSTVVVSGAATTEIGNGLYSYTLSAANTATAGMYTAVFTTTSDSVDANEVPACWVIGSDWVQHMNYDVSDVHTDVADVHTDLADVHADIAATNTNVLDVHADLAADTTAIRGDIGALSNFLNGPGSEQYTVTVLDNLGTAVAGAKVWVSSDGSNLDAAIIAGYFTTDSSGQCSIRLTPENTVYFWVSAPGRAVFPNPISDGLSAMTHSITLTGTIVQNGLSGHDTFDELRAELRLRLNDVDEGNYTDAEIDAIINRAYRDTMVACRSRRYSFAPLLSAGGYTIDVSPIFEVTSISVKNGDPLTKVDLSQLPVYGGDWQSAPNGTPTMWAYECGGRIVVYPKCSADTTFNVWGYAADLQLVNATDQCAGIPSGCDAAILDAAEAEARKRRATYANNASLYAVLLQSWQAWCAKIVTSQEGKS